MNKVMAFSFLTLFFVAPSYSADFSDDQLFMKLNEKEEALRILDKKIVVAEEGLKTSLQRLRAQFDKCLVKREIKLEDTSAIMALKNEILKSTQDYCKNIVDPDKCERSLSYDFLHDFANESDLDSALLKFADIRYHFEHFLFAGLIRQWELALSEIFEIYNEARSCESNNVDKGK